MRNPTRPSDIFGGQKPLLERDTILGEVAIVLDMAPEVLRERCEQLSLRGIADLVQPFADMMGVPAMDVAGILQATVGLPTLAPKLDDDIN